MPASSVSVLQIVAIVFGLALLGLFPPVHGRMLLVPFRNTPPLAGLAVDRGAGIIGMGPVPGSIVVEADRSRIASLLAHGVVPIAAPIWACGAAEVGA